MLTETERKRLRKRQRAERLAEQKERVMLGLEPVRVPRFFSVCLPLTVFFFFFLFIVAAATACAIAELDEGQGQRGRARSNGRRSASASRNGCACCRLRFCRRVFTGCIFIDVFHRRTAHDARNHARMLTPAQRKDKKRRKLVEDTAAGSNAISFGIESVRR